jgi:hypothetical protein
MKPYMVILRGRSVAGPYLDQTVFVAAFNVQNALKRSQNIIPGFKPVQAQEASREVFDGWATKVRNEYSRLVEMERDLSM